MTPWRVGAFDSFPESRSAADILQTEISITEDRDFFVF